MPYPDVWGVNKHSAFMDEEPSVKSEFGDPCQAEYNKALKSLKFLKRFHNINDVLKELAKDVL